MQPISVFILTRKDARSKQVLQLVISSDRFASFLLIDWDLSNDRKGPDPVVRRGFVWSPKIRPKINLLGLQHPKYMSP